MRRCAVARRARGADDVGIAFVVAVVVVAAVVGVDAQRVVQLNSAQLPPSCVREVQEDVCPQREGYDDDCDRRCEQLFPLRVASRCQLRNTGTLLSFFGIRSFICKCELPPFACTSPQAHPLSRRVVGQYAQLLELPTRPMSCAASNYHRRLACRDQFDSGQCGWQLSPEFQWMHASPNGFPLPFTRQESPLGNFLVGWSRGGVKWATVSTCESLCSLGNVNVSARVWRPPHVLVELCFREKEATMCAPVHISNGRLLSEVIPETDQFQITFRFSNLTADDVLIVDDLVASYDACPAKTAVAKKGITTTAATPEAAELVQPMPTAPARTRFEGRSAQLVSSSSVQKLDVEGSTAVVEKKNSLAKRICQGENCRRHLASHAVMTEMCRGRAGLLQCRAKCRASDGAGSGARCVRSNEPPFGKKCVCQLRRSPSPHHSSDASTSPRRKFVDVDSSPAQLVDGGRMPPPSVGTMPLSPSLSSSPSSSSPPLPFLSPSASASLSSSSASVSSSSSQASKQRHWKPAKRPKLYGAETVPRKQHRELCAMNDASACNAKCKRDDVTSWGVCDGNATCQCHSCTFSLCNFEKGSKCGWADLRMMSSQFNNISIAMKRGDENRYGLSKMRPHSYSGLVHRGDVDGPILLSVDAFPSHVVDVRICVQNLRKCQTQQIAAKSWNRVTAKIRVLKADKIFILFHNRDDEQKAVAMDNISVRGGDC